MFAMKTQLTPAQMFANGNASVETWQSIGRGATAIEAARMIGEAINERAQAMPTQPPYNDHDIDMLMAQIGSAS